MHELLERALSIIDAAVFVQEMQIRQIDEDLKFWQKQKPSEVRRTALEKWQRKKEISVAKRDQCLKLVRMINDICA
ncbi:hypothetical protein F7731_23820 [Cytobacillus depressus]|uniref:Uncharacterized protein n=1 Tax=Cytobacillus depressus TaxID=1602942 RepID=A0A6L3V0L1_9BACI|nr:hypothetical protein [Cytobacillus depressus]KAB2328981.1 hypothetical protein F7731_23820 [Cytobacillus depressus]